MDRLALWRYKKTGIYFFAGELEPLGEEAELIGPLNELHRNVCQDCGLLISARLALAALYRVDKRLKHGTGYICDAICSLNANINSLCGKESA